MDVIKLAREAGIIHAQDTDGQWDGLTDQQLLGYPYKDPRDQQWAEERMVEILKPFTDLVLEEAAKVCDSLHHWTADCCAKDIRQMKHNVVNIDK